MPCAAPDKAAQARQRQKSEAQILPAAKPPAGRREAESYS
jgi:hypothetical protein